MKEFAHPGGAAKRPVDLNHGIRSTITVSTNEWKHVAEVVADLDPSLPMITCLPDQINQVFLNLIVNAAHAIREKLGKSSAAKGTIIIQSRRVEDSVEIRVTDTGCGIPPTIASRVFDPFFTTKEVGKGTGQGLAIARSVVVDKHGGTITFESTPGEGTVFIIRLPCRPLDAGVESGESTSEPQGARDTVVLTELKGLLPSTASQHQPAAAE
jgi:signal transduction histidine kinase